MCSVLLLEDDDDLRETLAAVLEASISGRVLTARTLDEVIHQEKRALAVTCSILDVNLGPGRPTGVDAGAWLRHHGYSGRILFLTGHAGSFPQLREACRQPDTLLLEKPVPMTTLLPLVEEACR